MRKSQFGPVKKENKAEEENKTGYDYDHYILEDAIGKPYLPTNPEIIINRPREENPVVFLEVSSAGGRRLRDRSITEPQVLGRLYFEMRSDICPVACANFVALCTGARGIGKDGIKYSYKGIRIHRIIKNLLFQSGDLLDSQGNCSRSIYNDGGVFRDENFILRHAGAGCISYCNRGFDTNGSLFQVCITQNSDLDGRYVVFGCLAAQESYDVLGKINDFGTAHGDPLEEIRITDCGMAYPLHY